MKNTASTFIQYLENKLVPGNEKISGFVIEKGNTVIFFSKFPSITEWLEMTGIWTFEFEQDLSKINMRIKDENKR